ncbi:LutC/YkgG family protein [Amphritea pacifica]|uniref:LutC/YkgG family protein n=1 Tax=Amphritea pacifica TaxID=2811233 RepID=UPI0019650DD9|nr:LUD domain-containing protein [Amphritea pacifica]MBN1006559.1 LUD domain-containing protein [Amphritea pacifica]
MSRAEILGNIRRGLSRSEAHTERQQAVQNRLACKLSNLIPQRAQLPAAEQVELFKTMATEAVAELIELDRFDQVPSACADWLSSQGIRELICASNSELRELDWSPLAQQQIDKTERVAQAGDIASLTLSFAGIAETGTLMLHSGEQSPTTLNFLPDNHLVVLHRSAIVGVYEEAWKKLREKFGNTMPRTVNMITGPSRSADIEQKLQMGAHGPKKLVILLIND